MRTSIGVARGVMFVVCGAAWGCTITPAYPPPAGYRGPPPGYVQAPPPYPPAGYQPRAPYPPPPAYSPPPRAGYQATGYQPPAAAGDQTPPAGTGPAPGPCIDPGPQDISDLFERAAKIAAGATVVGCTAAGDADLFAVAVPPGHGAQLVRFSMRGQGDMVPLIRVFDGNRKRIEQLSVDKHQELRGWAYVAAGTSFYLWVSQYYSANDVYTLTTSATPVADVGEPDDDAARARPLVPGRPISAFLAGPLNAPAALEDWFRIDQHHDGDLVVDVDMSQGISPSVKLFDANRHEVDRQSAGPGERFQFKQHVKRGVYNLMLTCIYGVGVVGQDDPAPWLTRPYTISLAR